MVEFQSPVYTMCKVFYDDRKVASHPKDWQALPAEHPGALSDVRWHRVNKLIIGPADRFLAENQDLAYEAKQEKMDYHFRTAFAEHPDLFDFVRDNYGTYVRFAHNSYSIHLRQVAPDAPDNVIAPIPIYGYLAQPYNPANIPAMLARGPAIELKEGPFFSEVVLPPIEASDTESELEV